MSTRADLFVVDDDPKSRKILAEIFKLAGYGFTAAATGREALQAIRTREFAVALIDLRLGDMSGLEVMKGINECSPGTQCILLTGYGSRKTAIEAINLGAYSYIQKPYDMDQLLVTIQRAVEKRNTERALRQSEEQYRRLVEGSPGILYESSDKRGRFYYSPQVKSILGYSPSQLYADPQLWQRSIHPDDAEAASLSQPDYRVGQKIDLEYRIKDASGNWHWLQDRSINTHELDGEKITVGLATDITELRQKELALQQAVKLEAIGQLTDGIAHDFNNLLSVISGNLDLLSEEIDGADSDINEMFADAVSAVEDGAKLTQRLLSFARTNAQQTKIRSVNRVLKEFTRFLTRMLGEHTELHVHFSPQDPMVDVDPNQLESALLNLAVNARAAMPEGGKLTITVECQHLDPRKERRFVIPKEDDYVVISVLDTGIGIEEEDLCHVLEPFFTTKPVGVGSGLGLSMVYGFAQRSGGACHIESTVGEGTKVMLVLPKALGEEEMVPDKVVAADDRGGGETILVVEDKSRVRRLVEQQLESLGYIVHSVDSAELAMAVIQTGRKIDLMFSDIRMPGEMNGYHLAAWVDGHFPDIKIVLTTGYAEEESNLSQEVRRKYPLIRKPYFKAQLASVIGKILDGEPL